MRTLLNTSVVINALVLTLPTANAQEALRHAPLNDVSIAEPVGNYRADLESIIDEHFDATYEYIRSGTIFADPEIREAREKARGILQRFGNMYSTSLVELNPRWFVRIEDRGEHDPFILLGLTGDTEYIAPVQGIGLNSSFFEPYSGVVYAASYMPFGQKRELDGQRQHVVDLAGSIQMTFDMPMEVGGATCAHLFQDHFQLSAIWDQWHERLERATEERDIALDSGRFREQLSVETANERSSRDLQTTIAATTRQVAAVHERRETTDFIALWNQSDEFRWTEMTVIAECAAIGGQSRIDVRLEGTLQDGNLLRMAVSIPLIEIRMTDDDSAVIRDQDNRPHLLGIRNDTWSIFSRAVLSQQILELDPISWILSVDPTAIGDFENLEVITGDRGIEIVARLRQNGETVEAAKFSFVENASD